MAEGDGDAAEHGLHGETRSGFACSCGKTFPDEPAYLNHLPEAKAEPGTGPAPKAESPLLPPAWSPVLAKKGRDSLASPRSKWMRYASGARKYCQHAECKGKGVPLIELGGTWFHDADGRFGHDPVLTREAKA